MDYISMIDEILDAHQVKLAKLVNLETALNDSQIADGLEETLVTLEIKDRQQENLPYIKSLFDDLLQWLTNHFAYEEKLLDVVTRHCEDTQIVIDYNTLLRDHKDLLQRLRYEKEMLEDLFKNRKSSYIWLANASDLKAHVSATKMVVEAHAASEEQLLQQFRQYFKSNKAFQESGTSSKTYLP
jgi:hemerythrin